MIIYFFKDILKGVNNFTAFNNLWLKISITQK